MTVGILPCVFWTGSNCLVETVDCTFWRCHKILLSCLCKCALLPEAMLSVMDTFLVSRTPKSIKSLLCCKDITEYVDTLDRYQGRRAHPVVLSYHFINVSDLQCVSLIDLAVTLVSTGLTLSDSHYLMMPVMLLIYCRLMLKCLFSTHFLQLNQCSVFCLSDPCKL